MRRLALIMAVLGLVAVVVGTAAGCGRLFSFNGRHPVAVHALTPGTPVRQSFPGKAGRRYTLAVHVVFEREGLPESNGQLLVEARLPIHAWLEDTSGVPVAKIVGWIDPNEAPTVLYGHAANANQRRPMGVAAAELVAERLIGPLTASSDRDITYVVDLGPDQLGKAPITEARCAIYDDALPTSIKTAFGVACAGVVTLVCGVIMLFFGVLRSRGGSRRRQIV